MRRIAARSGLAVAWGLLASLLNSACAGWPPFRDRSESTAYTEQELYYDLAAHAARFASLVAATADEIEDLSDSRRVRRSTLIWRLRMIPMAQELAFGDDPQESYVESLGFTFAMRNRAAGDGRAELLHWEKGRSTNWRLGDELIEIRREGPYLVQVSTERAGEGARRDLTRMVETARAFGLPILLVTYPYEEFGWVNDATRSVARELDVAMLETVADLARARVAGYTRDELVVSAAGPHPRGVLHGYIAESMADRVLALLGSH